MPQIEWLVAGGAIAAGITAFWQQLKSIVHMCRDAAVSRVEIRYPNAGKAFLSYCMQRYRRGKLTCRHFEDTWVFDVNSREYVPVAVERLGRAGGTFWRWCLPLQVKYVSIQGEMFLAVSCVRGTFDLEKLIRESLESFNRLCLQAEKQQDTARSRFSVQRLRGTGSHKDRMVRSNPNNIFAKGGDQGRPPGIGDPPSGKGNGGDVLPPMDRSDLIHKLVTVLSERSVTTEDYTRDDPFQYLPFPSEAMALLAEAQFWLKDGKWHTDKGWPHRLSWMFYGPGGTGKTAFVRAAAIKLKIPLLVFDLASMNDEEFLGHWTHCRSEAPCIVLMEDFDTVFHGRENVLGDGGGGLTINTLLNALSGAEAADGILTVITTNHKEHIDDAIGVVQIKPDGTVVSSRPGRVDRILEFGAMTFACRQKLAETVLGQWPQAVEAVMRASEGEKASQFCQRVRDVARLHRTSI